MNQKGSTLIFVLIIVVLTFVIAGSAFYLGNRTAGNSTTNPNSTPAPIPTIQPSQTPSPTSSPAQTSSDLMTITRVHQAACTSSSCSSTTTLVIDGLNLNLVTTVSAQGVNDQQTYQGILGNIASNGQEIIVDFLNLPCQTYKGTISYSLPHDQPVTFSFTPATCQ